MRALLCKELGPPSSLVVEDLPDPVAGPGEVVVRVAAVGLNFFDTLVIQGRYQVKPALPFSPGAEVAGTVEAVGAGVDGFAVGDRVVAWAKIGGCREKIAVPARDLVRLADGVSFEAAAAVVVTHGTTYHALKDRGDLKPGETLAVLGASGGVGQAAIELGKLMGARVIACASGSKLAFCREMGADETIDYETEDLRQRLKELTGGKGVDVVYDAVGDRFAEPAIRSLGWGGRHLVIGFAAGEIPKIPLNLLLLKGADCRGVFWGEHVEREPARHAANMGVLFGHLASGALKPHVHAVVDLAGVPAALEDLASRRVKGKIIVRP